MFRHIVSWKQPLWCTKFIELLHQKGLEVILDLYGKGTEQKILEDYIKKGKLHEIIRLHGNQPKKLIKEHLQKAHFCCCHLSLRDGKGNHWGYVLVYSNCYSCFLCSVDVRRRKTRNHCFGEPIEEAENLLDLLKENSLGTWESMSQLGAAWSRNYTLDAFELSD